MNSLVAIRWWRLSQTLGIARPSIGSQATLTHSWLDPGDSATNSAHEDLPRYCKQLFRKHHDLVRQRVAEDNLLEFRATQGWEPLFKFLGEKVPEGPYPRAHDWRTHQDEDDAYMQTLYNAFFQRLALLGFGGWWVGFLRSKIPVHL